MGEINFLVFFIPFKHREINDPAEFIPVFINQFEFFGGSGSGIPCKGCKFAWFSGNEETGIAISKV